ARVSSPLPGRSILITSAPRSPRSWPQKGPARTRDASITRSPARGWPHAMSNADRPAGDMSRSPETKDSNERPYPEGGGFVIVIQHRRKKKPDSWPGREHMDPHTQALHVYRELADRFAERGDAAMRDRFLILAADAALAAGLPDEAEWLRHRLLQASRH